MLPYAVCLLQICKIEYRENEHENLGADRTFLHSKFVAERLGYGTRAQDFKGLHVQIKDVRDGIDQNKDSKGILAKVSSGLQSIKDKFSRGARTPASAH